MGRSELRVTGYIDRLPSLGSDVRDSLADQRDPDPGLRRPRAMTPPAANPPGIGATFDDVVASTNPAMVIVTARSGAEAGGCLVGFHCQTSIRPRRYGVWISRANRTFGIVEHALHLGVHFLASGQRRLAETFGAETGDDIEKLAEIAWTPHPTGVPLLGGCPVILVGHRVALLDDGGDHVLVTLEPVEMIRRAGLLEPMRLSEVDDIAPGHPRA